MSTDPADKLAAPSFGFKKKRGDAKPTKPKPEKTRVLEQTETTVAPPEAPAEKVSKKSKPAAKAPAEDLSADAVSAKAEPGKSVSAKTASGKTASGKTEPAEKVAAEKGRGDKRSGKQESPKAAKTPRPAKAAKTPRQPRATKDPDQRRFNLSTPSGMVAAVMVGVIVGAFMATAIWFSGTVSQWTRGTSSLGDKGAIVLFAVFALSILIGGYLLRLASTRSAFTISFLGSALVAVLSMLFLTEALDQPWAVILVVGLTAAAYALAYWITTNYID